MKVTEQSKWEEEKGQLKVAS